MSEKQQDFDPVERVDQITKTVNEMKSRIRELEKEARMLRIQAMGQYLKKYEEKK
jgi:hypothetical protein